MSGTSKAGWGLSLILILAMGIADYRAYFSEWQASEKTELPFHRASEQGDLVHRIYRDDLQQLADFLQDSDAEVVAVSTPNKELDPLLYKYAGGAAKVDTNVVFFYGQFNIALSRQPMLLFLSPLSPISEKHAHWLSKEYGAIQLESLYRQDGQLAFDIYQLGGSGDAMGAVLERRRGKLSISKARTL